MKTLKQIRQEYLENNPDVAPWDVEVKRVKGKVFIHNNTPKPHYPFKLGKKNSGIEINL